MKKISTLFLLAVGVLVLGTVSSCKDYDEDAYNDLSLKNATLQQTLDQQISNLNALIARVDAINSCNCSVTKPWIEWVNDQGFLKSSDLADYVKMAELDKYMKSADLEKEINKYLDNAAHASNVGAAVNSWISTDAGKAALENIIKDYLQNNNYNAGTPGLSKEQVEALIQEYIAANPGTPGLTQEAVETVVENYLAGKNYLTQQEVNNMISGFVQSSELNCAIATYLESVGLTNEVITNLKALLAGGPYVTQADYAAKIEEIDSAVATNAAKLTYVVSLAQNDSARIDSLEETIKDLVSVSALQSELSGVRDSLSTIYVNAVADHAWISLFKANYSQDSTKVWNRLTVISDSLVTLKNDIAASLLKANNYTDSIVNKAVLELRGDYEGTLGDLNTQIGNVEQTLQLQIDTLKTDLSNLTVSVNNLKDDLDLVAKRTNALVDRLNKQVTGIIVQGAACPLLLDATLALPVNLQSNVLCAYYGETQLDNIKFPSTSSAPYVAGSGEKFTSAEVAGVERLTFDQGDELSSTAGKVYLTINPNTVNFTGARLKLVDSQNNEAGIRLKPLAKSNKVLYFGASRAADNGFYEAEAELVDAKKAAVNTSGLKAVGSDIVKFIKNRTGIKNMITDVLSAVYKTVKMPAYAVQAPYSWTDENGVKQTAYVHSNYGIAATAIKPISYNLPYQLNLDDKMQSLPHKQIDILNNVIDRIESVFQNLKTKMDFTAVFGDSNIKIKWTSDINIMIAPLTLENASAQIDLNKEFDVTYYYDYPVFDSNTGLVKFELDENGVVKTDENGDPIVVTEKRQGTTSVIVKFKEDVEVSLKEVTKEINNAIIDQLNEQLATINGTLKENIESMNDEINAAVNEILQNAAVEIQSQLNGAIDDLVEQLNGVNGFSQINSLIDRVNSVLTQVYNRTDNISYYLQPTMFCGSQLKLSMMGASKKYATITKGDMMLYPSSFFAETINPAYKKFVKVVNVTGGSAALCQEAMDKANAAKNMNKVVDGNVRAVKFDTDAKYAGLTYEIAYAAMDYAGYQTVHRYYVKVVK